MLYTVEQYNKDSKPIELAPWRICIVTQVEEDKIVIRMLLIILIIIVTNTFLAQLQTFFCSPSLPSSTKKLGKIEFPTGPICVILLSSLSMGVTSFIEVKRRNQSRLDQLKHISFF
uniref:Uncharacterized protein n=1 Tax=Lactuca sativa TaxID=4236 RepID=A0A9R1WSS5_LACSA|nr:hypothetical protein LSAT_V11C900490230 [Lactuca sativa]